MLRDRETVAVRREGAANVALRNLHIAYAVARRREIALPARIARIGTRQPLDDGQTGSSRLQRARKVALRHLHVPDPDMRRRQIALPACVSRIRRRQSVKDDGAVAIGLQCVGKVARRRQQLSRSGAVTPQDRAANRHCQVGSRQL